MLHWLSDLSLEQHVPAFRKAAVDGSRLLELSGEDLANLGLSPEEQRLLQSQLAHLPRRVESGEGESTRLRRSTILVKEVQGVVRVFDEETGEEIRNLSEDILNRIRAANPDWNIGAQQQDGPRENPYETAPPSANAEFRWEGDESGWSRQTAVGAIYEQDWNVEDVCAWLEHVDLPECIPTFRSNHIDGPTFRSLQPEQLFDLGAAANLAHEVTKAGELFNCRASGHKLASASASHTSVSHSVRHQEAGAPLLPEAQLPPLVDIFAYYAPWYRCQLTYNEAVAEL